MQLFYIHGGNESVTYMINFSIYEVYKLPEEVAPEVDNSFNTGWGKRYSKSLHDRYFMLLVVLHAGRTWDFHANMFEMRVSTFKRNKVSLPRAWGPISYKLFITDAEKTWTYRRMEETDFMFSYLFGRRYATYVCFQQC